MLMTGISGSGKTTLANAVAEKLRSTGINVQIIDGDETRELIGGLFGHSREERMKMSRVNMAIGHYLVNNGISVIYALVSPYEKMRQNFKKFFGSAHIEIFISTPLEVCASRDVKGLYRLAKEEKIEHLNGANDEYELPANSDLVIDTKDISVIDGRDMIIDLLRGRGYAI